MFFFMSGCSDNKISEPITWSRYINIPDADIIFQTFIPEEKGYDLGKEAFGFYRFEDQSINIYDLGLGYDPFIPYYLNKNTIMMMDKLGEEGMIENNRANIFIFSKINFLTCDYIGFGYPFKGNIVFDGMEGIQLISSHDCSILKTYITKEEMEKLSEKYSVGSYFLSNNEDYLLMSLDQELVKITLPDKEIYHYQKKGCCSAISPDQKKIVYLANDGFHIMGINGDGEKLVVPYYSYTSREGVFHWALPSLPVWSNDCKKIIYHKCTLTYGSFCNSIEDYSIFLYDLDTETETLLVKSGVNPSWRPEE
jgi:hypothetical protein